MTLSLNTRTMLGAGLVLGVFLVLTGWTLDRAFDDSARSAVLERLRGQLYLLLGETEVAADGTVTLPAKSALARLNQADSGLYASIASHGRQRWQSASVITAQPAFIAQLPAGEEQFGMLDDRSGFVLGYGIEWQTGASTVPLTLSLVEDATAFRAQVNNYRRTLWGWLGGMAVLLLLAQLAVLRWGLRPLRAVADELQAIEQGQQDSLQADYPAELQGLTGNLNGLLHHERAQQQRYRNALADLAHSLKTPLAVLHGAADDATTVREQIDRMQQSVDYQLQRAATAGRSGLGRPVDLQALVESLDKALQKVHADKHVQLDCHIELGLQLRADQGDLTELLGNLLDNAYKWSHSRITLEALRDGRTVRIRVTDDGPGIAPELAEDILQRGVRADETTPGHGIGLAMVRDIVAAYDGKLVIENRPEGGLAITLSLPG